MEDPKEGEVMEKIAEKELEECSKEELLKILTREINENRKEREEFRKERQREKEEMKKEMETFRSNIAILQADGVVTKE